MLPNLTWRHCSESLRGLASHFQGRTLREFFLSATEVRSHTSLPLLLEKLIFIRVCLLTLILGAKLWTDLRVPSEITSERLLYSIVLLTYAISLLNAILLRKVKSSLWLGYSQLATDIALASLALYATNSLAIVSLYFSVIIAAAFLFGRFGAVTFAAISGLCYAVLSSGLISSSNGVSLPSSAVDILGIYGSLVLVALASSFLAKQLDRAGALLALRDRDLRDLSERERQLVNSLAEGIITLDLNSTITGINDAARAILGLSENFSQHVLGQRAQQALSDTGASRILRAVSETEVAGGEVSEISYNRPGELRDIRLAFNISPLTDSAGSTSGKVIRFMDVSHVRDIEEQLDLHERMTRLLSDSNSFVDSGSLSLENMVGSSEAMREVFSLVQRVAPSDASVLITGESGTGKELIARNIHCKSLRLRNTFVAINCGAIPETLIESELFGHKKGSFTGAVADKSGLFLEASGGTIFLDEIGELPLHLQSKLLRVLQERVIRPIGEVSDIAVDVRVLAATNRDLRKEVAQQRFREDLYYRLNVVEIYVPPLRERREDIPYLVKHFLQSSTTEHNIEPQVSPEALQVLASYDFPGNVRELQNLVERALVLGGGAILPAHLPPAVLERCGRHKPEELFATKSQTLICTLPIDLESELAKIEQGYLKTALKSSHGVKKDAAELLGLNFRSFRYRLKKYHLDEAEQLDDVKQGDDGH